MDSNKFKNLKNIKLNDLGLSLQFKNNLLQLDRETTFQKNIDNMSPFKKEDFRFYLNDIINGKKFGMYNLPLKNAIFTFEDKNGLDGNVLQQANLKKNYSYLFN